MSVLFDYFSAPSSEAAAATIDWPRGPAGGPTGSAEAAGFRFVSAGFDPTVQAGTLEEILTGRAYDDIIAAADNEPLAERDGGERVVLKVSDGLVDALAAASSQTLADAAGPWSMTDEFWGAADPEMLARILVDLSELARNARSKREGLYCWVCV